MEREGLPPGFRFFPTEEELVTYYLPNKIRPRREHLGRLIDLVIPVVDIYEFNPWDLPRLYAESCRGDPEQWFFFIPRQESEARGGRPRRLTTGGYWKATGCPGYVYSSGNNRIVGLKRTMVFYQGRAPTGAKTEWKMNEYKAVEGEANPSTPTALKTKDEFSLCRVYKKSKTQRSFDRRPQVIQMTNPVPALEVLEQTIPTASTSQVIAGSAGDLSSGEEDRDNSGPFGEMSADAAMEYFMDWDQVNWF
ncbi:hypothetical protein MLD38_032482 [Melastoma candidum]|uniref:Uncharacterized protein n=1 Tax=Melastoma candidum TaxID=119954 RepID=A0ACB9M3U5_9MYRT|nr:hypothetical protein MLD38_032482 [Melastoma candidum]